MQLPEFFRENELHGISSPTPANFELWDHATGEHKKYCCYDSGRIMRMLSAFPAGTPGVTIYQLMSPATFSAADAYRTRLCFGVAGVSQHETEQYAGNIMRQFARCISQEANEEARRAPAHFFYQAEEGVLVALWPTVNSESVAMTRAVANFIVTSPASRIEGGGSISDYYTPHISRKHVLPGTGSLIYKFTCTHQGTVIPRQELGAIDKLYAEQFLVQRLSSDLPRGERQSQPVLRESRGVKLSPLFAGVLRKNKREQRLEERGLRGGDEEMVYQNALDEENKHAEYRAAVRAAFDSVVDLSNAEHCWRPNTAHDLSLTLLHMIIQESNTMLFSKACNLLNQYMARERAPGIKIWVKMPADDEMARGATLDGRHTVLTMGKTGLSLRWLAPTDEDLRLKALRGIKVSDEDGKYNWMEWYLAYGCREVIGPRFRPLALRAHITDDDQLEYINTFQGFRCHEWLETEEQVALSREISTGEARDNLQFLLDHVQNLCGGSGDVANILHGWFAHLCFYPEQKSSMPIMPILVGPPGCGKTSFVSAFIDNVLNSVHKRVITSVRHLTGHFNKESETTVITHCEEMDLKEQHGAEMRALQELVSSRSKMVEGKGVDSAMKLDFNRYILCTNVENPIITTPYNRRYFITAFCKAVALIFMRDKEARERYLMRLDAVLKDERVWRGYAHFLYTRFYVNDENMSQFVASMNTRRFFNYNTLATQMASLLEYKEWSVIGWLFIMLRKYSMFASHANNVILQDDKRENFLAWDNWAAMTRQQPPDQRAIDFKNHNWVECEPATRHKVSAGWWQKMTRSDMYKSYCDASKVKARMNEVEFFEEVRRLLIEMLSGNDQPPRLRFETEVTPASKNVKDKNTGQFTTIIGGYNITKEWVALAPLAELEDVVERALPNSLGFSWSAFREAQARNEATK
jgi:hypothetical protein